MTGTTPEWVKKYKAKLLEKQTCKLINENFKPDDLWATFTFTREHRPGNPEQMKDITQRFLGSLRRRYKKQRMDFKYIGTCVIGKKGAYSLHMVMNNAHYLGDIAETWRRYANNGDYVRVNFAHLKQFGEFSFLASYIVKNGQDDYKRTKYVFGKRVIHSRNLKLSK